MGLLGRKPDLPPLKEGDTVRFGRTALKVVAVERWKPRFPVYKQPWAVTALAKGCCVRAPIEDFRWKED